MQLSVFYYLEKKEDAVKFIYLLIVLLGFLTFPYVK